MHFQISPLLERQVIVSCLYLSCKKTIIGQIWNVYTNHGIFHNYQALPRDRWGKQLDEREQYILKWLDATKSIII
jgi:hypothetical protein